MPISASDRLGASCGRQMSPRAPYNYDQNDIPKGGEKIGIPPIYYERTFYYLKQDSMVVLSRRIWVSWGGANLMGHLLGTHGR